MKLYFTRHGETEWNLEHRVQGQHNAQLTEKGETQALRLRRRLQGLAFTRVYTSPLGRARQTADLLCEGTGIVPEPDERLAEVCLGDMEGQLMNECPKDWVDAFYHAPERFFPDNGEGYEHAYSRVASFLGDLETEDGCVLVVAHALVLRLIRLYLLQRPIREMMDVSTPGCCFCEADYAGGQWTLRTFGDGRCQNPRYHPDRFAYFSWPELTTFCPIGTTVSVFIEDVCVPGTIVHRLSSNGVVPLGPAEAFIPQSDPYL